MSTPQSTPVRHTKLGISSTKSLPLANEYKKLLSDQHQRLYLKHQQDLDLIDDIRSYVKTRLSIEKDYTSALNKLAKQHSNHIGKRFALLHQLEDADEDPKGITSDEQQGGQPLLKSKRRLLGGSHRQLDSSGNHNSSESKNNTSSQHNFDVPETPCSLYKVWSEHINRLQVTSRSRSDQFEQLILIVDKLKDIRTHKAHIGKKCLDTHLKRIQEDLLVSMVDLERARKLYYEDESQAKKARENEEKIKKKRSGLLTKFTDLQAKKEKSSAQREATDIQSTQARNDYIMALAAANAHLDYYYRRDLNDFIHLIDDGVLDHCKVFMATLSECDINSLKDSLSHAQFWSKLVAMTGSSQTNAIFMNCDQSHCLKGAKRQLEFEPCNNDPISKISLEHNADYALQHEIDKWFTWFKKECRNLSHLVHQLETCQNALADGKKSIELNGQSIDDIESKVVELKQMSRKCEAAKLKAQARLKVIKEGGMPIEEWSAVESEIAADMARGQEEQERAQRLRELQRASGSGASERSKLNSGCQAHEPVQLQVSRDSDESDMGAAPTPVAGNESMHNLASVSRSTTGYLAQKQQNAISGYSAFADPSLVWQDDYSGIGVWGGGGGAASNTTTMMQTPEPDTVVVLADDSTPGAGDEQVGARKRDYDLLGPSDQNNNNAGGSQHLSNGSAANNNMSIQSSSPLSAIVVNSNGQPLTLGAYGMSMMSEAYKSDYECDYSRTAGQQQAHLMRSSANSAEAHNMRQWGASAVQQQANVTGEQAEQIGRRQSDEQAHQVHLMLNRNVVAMYAFEKSNEDDLALEEDDVLVVTSVNKEDTNWVRARNVHTGEEGYVPSSYIRLQQQQQPSRDQTARDDDDPFSDSLKRQQREQFGYEQQQDETSQAAEQLSSQTAGGYCRAVYDYEPPDGASIDEQDQLPHLALVQGELMRIVDQGQDDGWWLVEKADGSLGHVPSMLVEELDEDEQDGQALASADEDDATDDGTLNTYGDATTGDNVDRGPDASALPPPPSIAAPVLALDETERAEPERRLAKEADESAMQPSSNSLVATSFNIIEPTPEVESRRFIVDDDDADDTGDKNREHGRDCDRNDDDGDDDRPANRPGAVVGAIKRSTAPPSDVSYSVINENFVLERPPRRPLSSTASDHHEPTIEEENSIDTSNEKVQLSELASNKCDAELEYQARMPAVTVVIDPVENIPRSPDGSFDEDRQHEGQSDEVKPVVNGDDDNDTDSVTRTEHQPANKAHFTAMNVDCSPILRHHAEEFSKMIIEEALMLAPGSRIGPSTSSASIDRQADRGSLSQSFSGDE